MNENMIRIYDSTGATPIADPDRVLDRAKQIKFSTVYPGGIFSDASFFIPCDPRRFSPIQHTQRIQIGDGLTMLWEGFITSITLVITRDRTGLDVQATGYWGLADVRYKYNRWIDRRFQSDVYGVWYYGQVPGGQNEKFSIDQTDQILISANNEQFSVNDAIYVTYNTNASSNVKRIKFDYAFSELTETNPIRAKKYTQIGASYSSNLTNLIDGNASTTQAVALAANDLLYIGVPIDKGDGITGFRFAFSGTNINNNAATLTLEYFTNAHTWQSITITDGTASGGACWAQDGSVTFTAIDGLHWTDVNGSQEFIYFRFGASAALDSVTIEDIFVLYQQVWTFLLYDQTNGTPLWSVTATGTGSQDITLSPTSALLSFGLASSANQIVEGRGIYGQVTNLVLVAESWSGTAKTTVNDLLEDMVHYLGTPFADDYTFIAANSYDLLTTGFVSDDWQTSLSKDMDYIGQFSATDEPYSVGVLESSALSGTNTSPVIYYEKVPLLTDYDYAVRIDEHNLSGIELVTSSDIDTLKNYGIVLFSDENGKSQFAYNGDYAGLADADSQTKYYKRTAIITSTTAATTALAGAAGAAQITAKKNKGYYVRQPLVLTGTIRNKAGRRVPVSHLRAGKRIKIEDFTSDIGDVTGSGLTFLITRTEYNDADNTIAVTCGIPDDLATYLARTE